MTYEKREFIADLAVIGSGLAGMAASIFALKRGISTAQAGNTGALAYTTGYLDLLGDAGTGAAEHLGDPWAGIRELQKSQPNHPLARVPENDIHEAFTEFTSFISECGIAYGAPGKVNLKALTPAGTTKPTFSVPATMQPGVDALASQARCVIIDFKGLRGFSGRQVVANLKDRWPGLTTERVSFPDMPMGEIYPEVMARALEVPGTREKLADAIKSVRGDAQVIGLPAILGMHNPDLVMTELSRLLGCPVFEIPTMPPSVPGIRLREMFEQVFPKKGLTLVPQQKVRSVEFDTDSVQLVLADNHGPIIIHAKAVILATGRFLSGGLEAEQTGIVEPLVNLPVAQPTSRDSWYSMEYMGRDGHAIHQCGIRVDDAFRPLDKDGKVVDPRLFAAGVILAHQDWIRGRCGAGVAISSAYRAVQGAEQIILQKNN
ncbi:glycerol-3-phosphate dehydrogenase subunit GlpB [Desulfopila aestuarii]|uniref:Glycerol-3-phosphate dehydrogenase subunit B n=1 Tax=Desulfopila aestuarii DSM 18488 TaxID=1121416 RepID=A0A1M7Y9S3_9BACT|nr:glycerol-3-phosphate dehydrogenase subunit GlpB [Desulfopila aestuarii]SHO49385.1 glycerol-3-phosphate dehydrogenase subunit B [Desulfopila aestuarii DSM 18488]